LGAVKNVGRGAVDSIVEARERLGRPFRDLFEFCESVDVTRLNRRVIEALILSGALDALPGRREQKLAGLDLASSRAQRRARDRQRGQASLFALAETSDTDVSGGVLPDAPPWSQRETLKQERAMVGLYLSAHPLDEDRWLLQHLRPQSLADLEHLDPDRSLVVCAIVTARKVVTSRKSGRLIAFLTVEDLHASAEVMCFGDAYEQFREVIGSDDPLVLALRTTRREGDDANRVVLERALTLEEVCAALVRGVRLDVGVDVDGPTVDRVLAAIAAHPGTTPWSLRIVEGEGSQAHEIGRRTPSRGLRPVPALLHELVRCLGRHRIELDAVSVTRLAPEPRPRWAARGNGDSNHQAASA
jgi:DNA polymerase III subunit alpha